MKLPDFWRRAARLGPVHLGIVYNTTFSMTDGRVHLYVDKVDGFRMYQLRVGHLWLSLDIYP